jgi:hypothetical protein
MDGMRELNLPRQAMEIREVVAEASRALALLDADRLEELALACAAFNRIPVSDAAPMEAEGDGRRDDVDLRRQAREAVGDMRVFARVLDATRTNLTIMRRLRSSREGPIEYSEAQARGWSRTESVNGNN